MHEYDYTQPGAYFITVCAHERMCVFGDIVDGEMRVNEAGQMVTNWFNELENHFNDIVCGEFVCMPNHVHFVLKIVGADRCVCPLHRQTVCEHGRTHRSAPTVVCGLPAVIQWFKTMTTNMYIRGVKHHAWPPFNNKLWQRNYYEHNIRNEEDLRDIREYIQFNPLRWADDDLHP
jgi:REP element-mobilizing transposase RayT